MTYHEGFARRRGHRERILEVKAGGGPIADMTFADGCYALSAQRVSPFPGKKSAGEITAAKATCT